MKEPATRRFRVLSKTTNYDVLIGDDVIEVDSGLTITLFSAALFTGGVVIIKKVTTGATTIIAAQVGETIDGLASRSLVAQWSSLTLYSNGTDWRTL